MRLLIITVASDPRHSFAGHVPNWIAAIARHCEHVDVLALQTGGTPPLNVRHHSLGKEEGRSRVGRWLRFVMLSNRLIRNCDAVFAMFSTSFVFGIWPFALLFRKPIIFWWAHGATPRSLKIAEKLVDRVVTSSELGFRVPSTKVRIVGQGIPTDRYRPADERADRPFTIMTVGRLTAVKRFEDLVAAVALLNGRSQHEVAVKIIGATDQGKESDYQQLIEDLIRTRGLSETITLEGDVPQAQMPSRYQAADVMVNLGETGSMDKVVLEAMACALPVLSSNEAYAALLTTIDHRLVLEQRNPQQLVERLQWLFELSPVERAAIGQMLRNIVLENHSLDALGRRLAEEIEAVTLPTEPL